MRAMHGFAALYRTRTRLIGCAMAIALASALAVASSASAATNTRYVALGDSLAFGYSQQIFNENITRHEPPSAFEHGYANFYLSLLEATESASETAEVEEQEIAFTNNGCPGETTDSFIGTGPLSKAIAGPPFFATGEPSCPYHYLAGFPLHHEYGGTKSQLESALEVVAKQSTSPTPVSTLSLNLGANDVINKILHKCEAEVKEEFAKTGKSKWTPYTTPQEAVENCEKGEAFGVFFHIGKQLTAIEYVIRNGSKFGGVDYNGKFIFAGFYNPYGRVYCEGESFASTGKAPPSCKWGKEVLNSSNLLGLVLNNTAQGPAAKFKLCYANPIGRFNPGASYPNPPLNHPEFEPFALQTLTNMNNKTMSNGKANGPDIHPTPLGYEEIANIMRGLCG